MLMKAGIIDEFQLNSALSHQRNLGGRLGASLVKLGYLSEEKLQGFLAEQLRLPRVDLLRQEIAADVLAYIPANKAREFNVIAVDRRQLHGTMHLLVAMSDPTNLIVIDALQFLTGCRVRPALAGEAAIREAIDRWYRPQQVEQAEPVEDGGSEDPLADLEVALPSVPPAVSVPVASKGASAEQKLALLLELLRDKGILSPEEVLNFGCPAHE